MFTNPLQCFAARLCAGMPAFQKLIVCQAYQDCFGAPAGSENDAFAPKGDSVGQFR